jgi:hypothetical protein
VNTATLSDADWSAIEAVTAVLTSVSETPSTIARRAHLTTHEAAAALQRLVALNEATRDGNGTRTRYRTRQFGEVPTPTRSAQ